MKPLSLALIALFALAPMGQDTKPNEDKSPIRVGVFELIEMRTLEEFQQEYLQQYTLYFGHDDEWEYLGSYPGWDRVYKMSRQKLDWPMMRKLQEERTRIKFPDPIAPPKEVARSKDFLGWLNDTKPVKETAEIPTVPAIERRSPGIVNDPTKTWPLANVKTDPAEVTVLSGTTFRLGGVPCQLLGVKDAEDAETRKRAEEFTKAWFKSMEHRFRIYNDSNPLVSKDGSSVVWIWGTGFYDCLNTQLVLAGLVQVDVSRWHGYSFSVISKWRDPRMNWRNYLREAWEGHQRGEELHVRFPWPPNQAKKPEEIPPSPFSTQDRQDEKDDEDGIIGVFQLKELKTLEEFRKCYFSQAIFYIGHDGDWQYLRTWLSNYVYKTSRKIVDQQIVRNLHEEKAKIKGIPAGLPEPQMPSKDIEKWLARTELLLNDLPRETEVKPVKVAEVSHYCEGVVVDREGNLFFSNCGAGEIMKLTPDGKLTVWAKTPQPNGHKILPDGTHLVCDAPSKAVLKLDANGKIIGTASKECDGKPLRGPNDLTLDLANGGFYFTDPGGSSKDKPIGTVHYVDKNGKTHLVASGLAFPNGIVLRPDGRKTLLVAESQQNRILEYPVTAPGKVGPKMIFTQLPAKGEGQIGNEPDGICLDDVGYLYVAHFGMKQVQVLSPEGKLLRRFDGGNLLTSNVAFAGPNRDQLYVTGGYGQAGGNKGALFRLDLKGVKGLPILPGKDQP